LLSKRKTRKRENVAAKQCELVEEYHPKPYAMASPIQQSKLTR
jgi:hypothetical protein